MAVGKCIDAVYWNGWTVLTLRFRGRVRPYFCCIGLRGVVRQEDHDIDSAEWSTKRCRTQERAFFEARRWACYLEGELAEEEKEAMDSCRVYQDGETQTVEKRCDLCGDPMLITVGDIVTVCSNGYRKYILHDRCGAEFYKAMRAVGITVRV